MAKKINRNIEFLVNDDGTLYGYSPRMGVEVKIPVRSQEILAGTDAVEVADLTTATASPASTTSMMIAERVNFTYSGGAISGAGHVVASYAGAYTNSPGKALSLVIGREQTLEHTAGTIALGAANVSTLNVNAGTFTEFVANLGQITSNAGTITKGAGYSARLTGNSGTVSEWNHFQAPAASRTGVTKLRFIKNEDPAANSLFAGSVCDSSFWISAPTNGGTTILTSDSTSNGTPVSTYVLNPAGTIASHTLTFPTAAMGNGLDDGQAVSIFTTQTITSLSYTAGPVMYGAPTTLAANGYFRMRYFSALAGWVRVG